MKRILLLSVVLLLAVLLTACGKRAEASTVTAVAVGAQDASGPTFRLMTAHVDGRMVYVGVGGEIDGVVNPDLLVDAGSVVTVVLENGDGMAHDVAAPDLDASSRKVTRKGATVELRIVVPADVAGSFAYYCTVSGHRQAGMEGRIVVRAVTG